MVHLHIDFNNSYTYIMLYVTYNSPSCGKHSSNERTALFKVMYLHIADSTSLFLTYENIYMKVKYEKYEL